MNTHRLESWLFPLECCTGVAAGFASWFLLSGTSVTLTFALLARTVAIVGVLGLLVVVVCLRRRLVGLRHGESQLRGLLEAAPDAVVLIDKEGRIARVNSRVEKLFGYAREELLGEPLGRIVRPRTAECEPKSFSQDATLTNRAVVDKPQYVGVHQSGRRLAVEVSFSALQMQEGALLYTIRDVTEQHQSQRRRAARHAVRRLLLEADSLHAAAPAVLRAVAETLGWDLGVWWDGDPGCGPMKRLAEWCSEGLGDAAFEDCLRDRSSLKAVGRPSWHGAVMTGSVRVREGASEKAGEVLSLPLSAGTEVVGVIDLFRQLGGERDEHLNETLGVIGAQIGHFYQRRRSEENVRRSEARKAAILEAALDAIVTLGHDGAVIEVNPAADRMFGHPAGGLVGRGLGELIASPGENWGRVLSKRGPSTLGTRLELSGRRGDGVAFPVEVAIAPIRAEGARMFTAYIRDLTERKKAEEALQGAEEQFRQAQKLEAVGRLAGGVAHDFNNLLTVIIGSAEQLMMGLPRSAKEWEGLETIISTGHRAADLTRQLLAFSRKQVLQPRVLEVNEVVKEMEKMLGRLMGSKYQLVTRLEAGLGPVLADPGQIGQVLLNLVVNARDAMPGGGEVALETANVDLPTSQNSLGGRHVALRVRDRGCGMDAATRNRIFEPFFTTKEHGKGTGLGLACVYGIITQSRGTIEVESQPGQGSTFTIYLPRADAEVRQEVVPALGGATAPWAAAVCGV